MQAIDSRIISFLRFPMIVGIVLIHSGVDIDGISSYPLYEYVVTRGIIGTITRVCVPLFFLISGYLFFCNIKRFDRLAYVTKLKKRGRSLLEPYLFYNALAICLFAIMGFVRPELQSGVVPPLSQWTPALFMSLFWDYGNNLPMVPQFWFVRNLMLIVLLSPVLYWLIKKTKSTIVLLLGTLWGGNIWEFGIPGTMGLFFFTIGAVASINQLSIFTLAKKMKFCGWVYPLLAAIDMMTKGEVFNIYIHNVGILSGMVLVVYGLGKWLERKDSAKPNEFLLASTFFVFACHSPYNGKLVHVMLCVLPSLSSYKLLADIQCILYYFLTATAWILILLSVFAMIKKMSPKTAIFLSGGR